jgi:hypothetical protein
LDAKGGNMTQGCVSAVIDGFRGSSRTRLVAIQGGLTLSDGMGAGWGAQA